MEVGEDFINNFDGEGSDGGSSSGRSEDEGGRSSSKTEEGEEAASWFAGFVGVEGCEDNITLRSATRGYGSR